MEKYLENRNLANDKEIFNAGTDKTKMPTD